VALFDQPNLRITKLHFLALYEALRPIAVDEKFDIQHMWGGAWRESETQLSFLNAFASLSPEQLDATTIPGLLPSFTADELAPPELDHQGRAAQAIRHPLVSLEALSAVFHVALRESYASDTPEAKRLFQEVVVPNLDIFVVSGSGVAKPWPELATDTINNLFDRFLYKFDPNYDFVLESLWRKDKAWVAQRLVDAHAKAPMELLTILDHAIRHHWLEDLVSIPNGFGLDLAAVAHARGSLDLVKWGERNAIRKQDLTGPLLTFLNIKATHELESQREGGLHSIMLPVKTIYCLLHILEEWLPKTPSQELIVVQRACITAYPRLINYGSQFDDIIDENGATSNSLPKYANDKMEEHYKRMYSDDLHVRNVVDALNQYKDSRDGLEQDIFACMIHGLFDEYALYHTYPLEALATTAVLFGGIISRNLISDLPLEIGLGMILEAVRDYPPDNSMYKFGLQALMQLFARLHEWPGFCRQLVQVPGLHGTEAWNKAEAVVREQQDEEAHDDTQHQMNGARALTNGTVDDIISTEPSLPPFSAISVEPPPENTQDPDEETQDKIQFVLNNITTENLGFKFQELKSVINEDNQVWFAGHLVQERARMQPNYHSLYLDLVKLFQMKSLWAHVLRETYACAFKTLNSEQTMTQSLDRTHLKNLAIWLGSLTLARDKPIKHKNIAFKQLLSEGYQSQRLLVVLPFICKVLAQGKNSTIFKPPNPWLMDILQGLMELYVNADLKLNMRFEIEVLCSELSIDHMSIEPSNEIMNRPSFIEEPTDVMAPESMDRYDNLSMNGISGEAGSGRFSTQEITSSIPDLGPLLTYPPANDMVNQARLEQIVKSAITRAVHEIISPVVERSVTIAAISTAQMIHKDFATEPNEARVRSAAINMVKKTAGSLALVTSKEPLRASMTNYIRALSGELPQGLPEGTIIMCVNSNLDTACSQVEKKAEERAVPEIEEMIEGELEARRHHRLNRPDEPYFDVGLSRWSWTIPAPYKLQPSLAGLNQEQMAIYDEFARHPRVQSSLSGTAHVPSSSDATRSMANEILQDPYQAASNIPTPAEQPVRPYLNTQQPSYTQAHSAIANGRISVAPIDPRTLIERAANLLHDLQHAALSATEQHYEDLPRPHDVLECLDGLYSLIIKSSQGPESNDVFLIDQICNALFSGIDSELVIESLVHVLENSCRIGGRTASRVSTTISLQPGESLLHVPLAVSLIKAGMIEWQRIDLEASRAIIARREGSLQFLSSLIGAVLLNDEPIALYGDFARSLEVAWQWIEEDPSLEIGQDLKQKLKNSGVPPTLDRGSDNHLAIRSNQMKYVFDEWVHLDTNPNASEKAIANFIPQMHNKQIINSRDDLCLFLRLAIDESVDRYEQCIQNDSSLNDAYVHVDELAKLITMLVKGYDKEGEVKNDKAAYLKLTLSIIVLVLNHHHVMRGVNFNQKVFYRLFSLMLCEFASYADELSEQERQEITLVFATTFVDLRPSHFPGFLFGWLALVSHRNFLFPLMQIPYQGGWRPLADIVENLMFYVGELLKPLQVPLVTKMIYRAVLKFVVVLQHDYPEFLAANQSKISTNIPIHSFQLHNLILNANPGPYSKPPDALQSGLKIDRVEEMRLVPDSMDDLDTPLCQSGLVDILDQALASGPSEDAVAHIAHAIQRRKSGQTGPGFVPINADLQLIQSLVVYIGKHSIARAELKGGPTFVATSPDVALLSMLVHELRPEPRYFFLSAIVDQLRAPIAYTHYFTQALLELFGSDLNDPEETDIRQQITRILLERLIGQWPQPWGLVVTIMELVKNEKYMFFELPFIKSTPEV
jgi:CCR4-NOT transcription complex subunit 1